MLFLLSIFCTLEPKKSYYLASTNATKSILLELIYDVKSVLQERIEAVDIFLYGRYAIIGIYPKKENVVYEV